MSLLIEQELNTRGVAEVIVLLDEPAATAMAAEGRRGARGAASGAEDLTRYFTPPSEVSQRGALAAALGSPTLSASAGGRGVRGARGASSAASAVSREPLVRRFDNLGVVLGSVTRQGLEALRKSGHTVVAAPPFGLIHPVRTATKASRTKVTWGIKAMGIPELWEKGLTGKGVKVGHLDTGVDGAHPALKGALKGFADFDFLGNERPAKKPYDTGDHGTHTAATIAGRPVNGRGVGVAPGAELYSAIVIEGGSVVARVLGGMDWAVGNKVRILSMSLGLRGYWEDFLPLTDVLRKKGILPVFAVGNEGPGTSRSPGNYPNVVSVGAVEEDFSVADFSSSQQFPRATSPLVPSLVAPGVGVISAAPGGGYQSMDGSSMATPHVAGLAALLLEAKPKATLAQLEAALFAGCKLLGNETQARANRGFLHGVAALEALE